jgi:hypothetical protein
MIPGLFVLEKTQDIYSIGNRSGFLADADNGTLSAIEIDKIY